MNQQLPKVYVSILNWNGYRNTIACLQSLQESNYENIHLVVIDNGSRDDSVGEIKKAFADIEIIQTGENLGFAGGHKVAVDRALRKEIDALWLLNNDLVVRPDALSNLVAAYQKYGIGLYNSAVLDSSATYVNLASFQLREKSRGSKPIKQRVPLVHMLTHGEILEVYRLTGSNIFLPTSLIEQYGFIDTSFFMYAEDTDYGLRLQAAGIPNYVVLTSVVMHEGRGSWKNEQRLAEVMNYYKVRNGIALAKRHFGIIAVISEIWKTVSKYLWKALLRSILMRQNLQVVYPTQYYQLVGLRDGLRGRMGRTYDPQDFI